MLTLVLGGARSGKSALAERLASRFPGPVTYVATAAIDPLDDDHVERIAAHRHRRDPDWTTIEAGADLARTFPIDGTVLVDSLGTWVAACPDMTPDVGGLCAVLRDRVGDTIVVSEEVGLGVHPLTDAGRRFRDVLGAVNVAVAEVADEVLLVVAGRALPLERR